MNLFKSQSALIAEIHNEFDTAQDRLLEQATRILSTPNAEAVQSISARLAKVGFVNTPTAKKGKEVTKELVQNREQAELITYYRQAYPFLKFLTEDELNRICEKYNLIHAPTANYIEEVPEKNLRDIENAQSVKQGDHLPILYRLKGNTHGPESLLTRFANLVGKEEPIFSEEEYLSLCRKYKGNTHWRFDESTGWFVISQSLPGMMGRTIAPDKMETIDKSGLFIAAPSSHFNLKGLMKKAKHGFFSVFETEVKDPIVFRYVRGGVQVITKWGLEANDPSLVVPVLN